jgi:crotonobetaine/carnitine-CoA ligase
VTGFSLEERTVGQVLARNAARFADKTMIESVTGESLTYGALDALSNRLAHGIAAFGIGHAEPVLIMLPDVIDYIALWCGLAKRGAVEVPVNLAYRGNLLKRICNDSGARIIVVDRKYLDRLEVVADELEHLECCIVYSEGSDEQASPDLPSGLAAQCRAAAYAELASEDAAPLLPAPAFHDLIAIMYTSGTTGTSKGVMTTHAHAFCYADGSARRIFEAGPEDVFYTAGLPLFHVAGQLGIVYGAMIQGATVVLRQGYKNEYFWPDIAAHRCTSVGLLGAIANFLWQQPESPGDAETPLRKCGMFPLIPEHEAFAARFGVSIVTAYASTECPPPCINHFGAPFPSNQCIGPADDGFEVRIFDEHDIECPPGVMGEICVRPRNTWDIMLGYWNQPEATARAFRNLWYHTGDAGYRDGEGCFYFVDRLTDSIRRRGENISSMEVEDEINRHPAVLECAVFPVWEEHTEQEVMAVITLKPGAALAPEALIAFLDRRIPYFMVPRYLDFAGEIQKTPTGKIQKYNLRGTGITPTTWDRVKAGVKLTR